MLPAFLQVSVCSNMMEKTEDKRYFGEKQTLIQLQSCSAISDSNSDVAVTRYLQWYTSRYYKRCVSSHTNQSCETRPLLSVEPIRAAYKFRHSQWNGENRVSSVPSNVSILVGPPLLYYEVLFCSDIFRSTLPDWIFETCKFDKTQNVGNE